MLLAGAKEVEPVPAKTIGEASLVGAVAEILGANYFLSYVGLKVVPAHLLKNETTETLETSFEEETVEVGPCREHQLTSWKRTIFKLFLRLINMI